MWKFVSWHFFSFSVQNVWNGFFWFRRRRSKVGQSSGENSKRRSRKIEIYFDFSLEKKSKENDGDSKAAGPNIYLFSIRFCCFKEEIIYIYFQLDFRFCCFKE